MHQSGLWAPGFVSSEFRLGGFERFQVYVLVYGEIKIIYLPIGMYIFDFFQVRIINSKYQLKEEEYLCFIVHLGILGTAYIFT